MKNILACLILTFLCVGFVHAQSKTKRTGSPTYTGAPETDKAFAPFIRKNLGRIVYLNLTIKNTDAITGGDKGGTPYFNGAKTNGIDYSYYLDCEKPYVSGTAIERFGNLVKWNESTGKLSGYFKVLRIEKSRLSDEGNKRVVVLATVKK